MKQRGLLHSTASFAHSSLQGPIPEHVRTRFQNFSGSTKEIGRAPIILTIVWKKGKYIIFIQCTVSNRRVHHSMGIKAVVRSRDKLPNYCPSLSSSPQFVGRPVSDQEVGVSAKVKKQWNVCLIIVMSLGQRNHLSPCGELNSWPSVYQWASRRLNWFVNDLGAHL